MESVRIVPFSKFSFRSIVCQNRVIIQSCACFCVVGFSGQPALRLGGTTAATNQRKSPAALSSSPYGATGLTKRSAASRRDSRGSTTSRSRAGPCTRSSTEAPSSSVFTAAADQFRRQSNGDSRSWSSAGTANSFPMALGQRQCAANEFAACLLVPG